MLFVRKALVARQGRVCEAVLRSGVSQERVVAMRVADLPGEGEARRCLELRERLGIAAGPAAPAFVTAAGEPLDAAGLGAVAADGASGGDELGGQWGDLQVDVGVSA